MLEYVADVKIVKEALRIAYCSEFAASNVQIEFFAGKSNSFGTDFDAVNLPDRTLADAAEKEAQTASHI
jgi:hypothetical protein